MNISELLSRNARKFKDKVGFVTPSERHTYGEVNEKVNCLANALYKEGIGDGDKVILFTPNTMEFIFSYFAIQRLGAVAVPINAKLATEEIRYIVEHSEAKAFIGHELLWGQVEPLVEEANLLWVSTGKNTDKWVNLNELIENGYNKEIQSFKKEDDICTMLYTSGTTGKPKGVLLSNRNVLAVATMMCIETGINDESTLLHMMPLSHSAPLNLFFVAGTYVGATHVLAPTFTPDLLLQLVSKEKVTHFFGAPVAYLLTAKHPEIDKFNLSSVKRWVYGGAPLSNPEVQFVQSKFKTNDLMCVYGLTEAGPNGTFLSPEDHEEKAGSIGKRAALNCEIRIVNEKDEDVAVGEIGEIILRGEGNMVQYYKDPEKTAETIRNGWLYTGDMGRVDDDGFFWVVDRKKDMILSGGVNIYPKEIEDALRTHPEIEDVAVIGVPHPEWGETVKAYVTASQPINDLETSCNSYLANKVAKFKIPRIYEQIEELPRNATGKILKHHLREEGIKS
ncbi:acyl-CoA synthetase (AMP-forming)/AMP-acid ligase II [Salirhabdus euzebyi]|uniref:Acyl-CoA synthetase (AMP-forming)/AMP-acid ligase II n=1 Tax=Salirhabdus euzebyi TaxID=394506 RepID=A0A841Q671_9BACI|nr:long-chain-fatty-acid--CoA ligase [Salirhabdus euzebyi]MBB6453875.1 acyl-CoA synthetase (AMP-forming)/AMP-acid ligase II [Salirhabdus euzebyi]